MQTKLRLIFTGAAMLIAAQISLARISNPYPVALIRKGEVYLQQAKGNINQLTQLGDVQELCWLDQETICFSRMLNSLTEDRSDWRGLSSYRDLFTINKTGERLQQFTAHHFASEPAPGPIDGRALFLHRTEFAAPQNEIWETLIPLRRDRTLGILGRQPDSSPNRKWLTATIGDSLGGVGIYRYPRGDTYRTLPGLFSRPRFSPDSLHLAYLSHEFGRAQIWQLELPDGIPQKLYELPDEFDSILDFGFAADNSGFILTLQGQGKSDVYYYEFALRTLQRLTDYGDVEKATNWH